MISEKMIAKLSEQVKHEWESEFFYLTFMAWCFNNNYNGFGAWFLKQASEEREHGMKMLRYLNEVDADISIPSITTPKGEYQSIEQIFQLGLEHELKVTGLISELMNLAHTEKDHATQQFLQWYVSEQVEEEANFRGIIAKLERIKGSPGGLFMLEAKLGERA